MTSAAGPMPKPAYETFVEFGSLLHLTGSVKFPQWIEYMEKSRISASRLLGAPKENIAFVKNTGIGLWIASRLVDWKHGDEIILPAGEFPSNIYPWLSLEEQGVSIKWIEPNIKDHPIPRVDRESILPLLTERTKLLSVSFILFCYIRAEGVTCVWVIQKTYNANNHFLYCKMSVPFRRIVE